MSAVIKETEYNFYALTPIDNADIRVYESALDFVFNQNKVKNVAISGSYGAGKSSVIESYKKKHSEKRFLHISLAHFKSISENDDLMGDSDKETIETILEGKILNQLIHQILPEHIPRTNFRVKRERTKWRNILLVVFLAIGIMLGIYTLFFAEWVNFVQSFSQDWLRELFAFSELSETRPPVDLVLFGIMSISVYYLIKLQENSQLIKKANI